MRVRLNDLYDFIGSKKAFTYKGYVCYSTEKNVWTVRNDKGYKGQFNTRVLYYRLKTLILKNKAGYIVVSLVK